MTEEYAQWLAGLQAGSEVVLCEDRIGIPDRYSARTVLRTTRTQVVVAIDNGFTELHFRKSDGGCIGEASRRIMMPSDPQSIKGLNETRRQYALLKIRNRMLGKDESNLPLECYQSILSTLDAYMPKVTT